MIAGMRRALKIVISVVAVLVLVVIALAIAVPLLFDLNDHKDRIAAEVHDATGRDLTIDGDLDLTIFPWLGVRTGAMSLAQPEGFPSDAAFASFSSANVRVKLMPLLLRREIQLDRIALDGLQLQLERDADGHDNWTDLSDRDGAPEADVEVETEAGDFDLDKIEIAGLSLTNARIAFRDAQAGASYTVENLNLETGEIRVDAPVEVTLDADISSGVPQLRGAIEFSGRVDYDKESGDVAIGIERALADLEGGVLPVARLRVDFSGNASGNLETEAWRADELALDIVARGGQLPDRDFNAMVRGAAVADLAAQTATLTALTFEGFGLNATVDGSATQIIDAPTFEGRLEVAQFSPRSVLGTLGRDDLIPETADPSALGHVELAGDVQATTSSIEVTSLVARLDASRLTGRVAVADFERQALRFELALDSLDLDRYLPPETPDAEDVDAGALDAVRVPADLIRGLDLDGVITIGDLRVAGLASREIQATIKAQDGLLRVNPATASLYGGTYTGDVTVDARGETPRIAMNERLRGVQAGPLFEDLFGNARITGVADLSAELTAAGHTIGEMRPTLAGTVSFGFDDGAIRGFDLWHLVRDARAVLRNQPRPEHDGVQETEFGKLSGSGAVRDGILSNDDLRADLPFMVVTGAGKFDVVQESVDYTLRVTVRDRPGVDDQVAITELKGRAIPVRIEGPLDELSYRVDVAEALKEEVERRARDEIQDRLREGLRRIIP